MSKNITVIPAGGGHYWIITIESGALARDIKQALDLSNDQLLAKSRGAEPFPDDQNLYDGLSDGDKSYATWPVQFAASFRFRLRYVLTSAFHRPQTITSPCDRQWRHEARRTPVSSS